LPKLLANPLASYLHLITTIFQTHPIVLSARSVLSMGSGTAWVNCGHVSQWWSDIWYYWKWGIYRRM